MTTQTEWFQANLLSLNVKKTSYIVFSNRRKLDVNIILANTQINRVDDTRFLGVIISSKLNWNKHIDVVVNKICKTVGIIAKVRYLLPLSATRTLYMALVEPYINYCNIVWAQSEPTTKLDRILKIQKKLCRLITFSHYREHAQPLFQQLSVINIYQTYKYQLAIFMFKQTHHLLPIEGTFSFFANSSIHSHFTRQHGNIHIQQCRTHRRQMTVMIQGPKLWNSLPPLIRGCPSFSCFKKLFKEHLLAQL